MDEGKKALSAAELRERRRQKILENQGSRMNRITGGSSSTTTTTNVKASTSTVQEDRPTSSSSILGSDDTDPSALHRRHTAAPREQQPLPVPEKPTRKLEVNAKGDNGQKPPKEEARSRPPAAGLMVQDADGSTYHPKLGTTTCRVMILLLGMFLSLFHAKYFLVTFCSWECAVFFINGWPEGDGEQSYVVLLVAILGVRDKTVQRLKFALQLGRNVVTDLSILIVSALMTRVVLDRLLAQKPV